MSKLERAANLVKKVDKGLMKTIKYTAAGFGLYMAGLLGCSAWAQVGSKEIQTQSELERLMEVERKKIRPNDGFPIVARLVDEPNVAHCFRTSDGNYHIELSKGGTDATLRHELYHILDGHLEGDPIRIAKDGKVVLREEFSQALFYLFYAEPQAVIYSLTGLKP